MVTAIKTIAGLGERAASSLSSLIVGPHCMADSRLVS